MIRQPPQQQTLARPVRVAGFGYWSGRDVTVEFRPAPPGSGVVFVRRDLDPPVRLPAHVSRRVESMRRSTLAVGAARAEMVEHVLAAVAGLRIDNCEIWLDEPELPGCDGSSLPFVEAIRQAGVARQDAVAPVLAVGRTIRVADAQGWIEAAPHPQGGVSLCYQLDYGPQGPIGRQRLTLEVTPESFQRELAPARTFLLEHEAAWLRAQGLGRRVTSRDLLVFGPFGPIDNQLRFADECVRHKTLDLIGDLALAGRRVSGRFTAWRSGHRLNAQLVRRLLDAESEQLERIPSRNTRQRCA